MTRKQNAHLTFKANVGVGRHGWLRLTPAYSVQLVRERVSRLPSGSVVTDPFSGTGTTPLAAAEHGHLGQSLDVNPFLVWLGKVKTKNYDAETLDKIEASVSDVIESARAAARRPGDQLWQPNLFKIERWWSPGALLGLKALRDAIDLASPGDEARDLFSVVLCRVLIANSNAAFNHQSMSFKDQDYSSTEINAADVDRAFSSFAQELADLLASARMDLPGRAQIIQTDARNGAAELEPCDLLLTSPPYVNRMSYIRELRPYMYWLRYLDAAVEAGELDWKAIGGTWGMATSRLNGWTAQGDTPVDGEMGEVLEKIAGSGGKNGPLLSNYVAKYFEDMWSHFQAAHGYVKPGGRVSYIVGNSTFYGNVVPAEQWYARMLRALDFEEVEVSMIRKRNSNKHLYEYEVTGRRK